jgi:acyl carrier protein
MANHEGPALSEDPASSDDLWYAQLLQLWRKFLKTEDVSIDDDFFEKGGDSILAIDLQLELQRLTGQVLPESLVFEASTVRALAKRLSRPAGVRQAPVIRTA